jgi:hypothetical protein
VTLTVPATRLATLPRPTTGRVVVLLTAIAALGAYAGDAAHNAAWGDRWVSALEQCLARFGSPDAAGTADVIASGLAVSACLGSAERARAGAMLAGALLTAVLAFGIVLAAPAAVRRRRRLRPLPGALAHVRDRVDALSRAMGVSAPAVLLGSAAQRDAFCFGTPGRPVLVLPPAVAVRVRQTALFDPLVRHELAHVRHHDVPLAWLARAFLVIGVAAGVLPLLLIAGASPGELAGFAGRAVLLVASGWLVARAVLRAREHDADLTAAGDAPADLQALLAGGPVRRRSQVDASGWQRLIAHHPTAARRVAVLADPASIARTGFVGGVLPAFFAAATAPVLISALTAGLTGTARRNESIAVAAALAGLVLAGSVGIDAWRAAVVSEGARQDLLRDSAMAAGVGVGVLLGDLTAPANVWFGFGQAAGWTYLVPAVLAACGTVVVCGLASVAAATLATLPRPAVVVAAGALVFGLALWIGWTVQIAVGGLGVAGVALAVSFGLVGFLPFLATTGLCVLAAVARGTHARADVVVGLVAGAVGGAVLVLIRLTAEPALTDAARLDLLWRVLEWGMAVVVLTVVACGVVGGPRGVVAGLPAAPVAAGTAVAAFVVFNTLRGGVPSLPFVWNLLAPILIGGVAFAVMAAPLALVGGGEARQPDARRSAVLAGVLVAAGTVATIGAGPLVLG